MLLGNVEISPPVMNAACDIAKTVDDVKAFARNRTGAIVIGSITVEPRLPNPEPRLFVGDGYAINSYGMPNDGIEYYSANLPEMIDISHHASKAFILSIAGFKTSEYGKLASLAEQYGVDVIEINLGCPNALLGDEREPIASYDPGAIYDITKVVQAETHIPITLKLSPYPNRVERAKVADVITALGTVSCIVLSNSMPDAFMSDDDDNPVVGAGEGGLSGAYMRPIVLGQVRSFRELLADNMNIIAVGGVSSRQDVEKYLRHGANAVQAATFPMTHPNRHRALDTLIPESF